MTGKKVQVIVINEDGSSVNMDVPTSIEEAMERAPDSVRDFLGFLATIPRTRSKPFGGRTEDMAMTKEEKARLAKEYLNTLRSNVIKEREAKKEEDKTRYRQLAKDAEASAKKYGASRDDIVIARR